MGKRYAKRQHDLICDLLDVSTSPDSPGNTAYEAVVTLQEELNGMEDRLKRANQVTQTALNDLKAVHDILGGASYQGTVAIASKRMKQREKWHEETLHLQAKIRRMEKTEIDIDVPTNQSEFDRVRMELAEMKALFVMQQNRSKEADDLYVAANPKPECPHGYTPDLGELLRWLMVERDKAITDRDAARADRDVARSSLLEVAELRETFERMEADEGLTVEEFFHRMKLLDDRCAECGGSGQSHRAAFNDDVRCQACNGKGR